MSLESFGFPGCTLHVSPDLVAASPTGIGAIVWMVPIPNDPLLLGIRFYNQGWAVDPTATPAVGMSNGGEALIGVR